MKILIWRFALEFKTDNFDDRFTEINTQKLKSSGAVEIIWKGRLAGLILLEFSLKTKRRYKIENQHPLKLIELKKFAETGVYHHPFGNIDDGKLTFSIAILAFNYRYHLG